MFWQEDEDKSLPYEVPDDVIDLAYDIRCKSLPISHAWQLSSEVLKFLPWINDYPGAGIHQIHVAESNNGWMRPADDEINALLYPSRRTKMTIRIPHEKLQDAKKLEGKILDIDGHLITVGKAKTKAFTNASVIFSRYVISEKDESENQFLERMAKEIKDLTGFSVKKMLCGKSHYIKKPTETLATRHLMIADLDSDTSIKIQQLGLGKGREIGCGIFLPHKGIKSLNSSE